MPELLWYSHDHWTGKVERWNGINGGKLEWYVMWNGTMNHKFNIAKYGEEVTKKYVISTLYSDYISDTVDANLS